MHLRLHHGYPALGIVLVLWAVSASPAPTAGDTVVTREPVSPARGSRPQAGSPPQDGDLPALLNRAVTLHQSGDLAGAAAAYEQVLRAAPQASRIRSNLGAAYVGLGRYEEAIEQYRLALPSMAGDEGLATRQNLALALQKTGRIAEARDEAAQVVAAQPTNRDAIVLLAECQLRLGEAERAVELLGPVSDAAPDDRAIAHLLGTALLALDRAAEAQVVMDRVFREDSPEAHLLLASMHAKRQDWAGAREELDLARAGNPDLPLVNYLYGQCLMKESSDWAGAAAAFRRELEIDPNHFDANLQLGTLLRQEGSHEEALPYLTRAARLRGDSLAVQFSLGALYVALGRYEEARPLLEEVAAAVPDHLQTHMQLAILHTRLGDTEEAARQRAEVIRIQKERESHAFDDVREGVGALLGQSSGSPRESAEDEP